MNPIKIRQASTAHDENTPIRLELESTTGRVERFEIDRRLNGGLLMDLAVVDVDSPGTFTWLAAVGRFLQAAFGADYPRMREVTKDWLPEELGRIAQKIVAEAAGHPSQPPAGSPSTPSAPGIESTGGSDGKAPGDWATDPSTSS